MATLSVATCHLSVGLSVLHTAGWQWQLEIPEDPIYLLSLSVRYSVKADSLRSPRSSCLHIFSALATNYGLNVEASLFLDESRRIARVCRR